MPPTRTLHLIGVPLDLGSGRRGIDMGPSVLRMAALRPRLAALGHSVVDSGDFRQPVRETRSPGRTQAKYIREIATVCRTLCQTATAVLADHALPVVIGADHSVTVGSVPQPSPARVVGGVRSGPSGWMPMGT